MKIKLSKFDFVFIIFVLLIGSLFSYYAIETDVWQPDEPLYFIVAKEIVNNNGMLPSYIPNVNMDKICNYPFRQPPLAVYSMSLFYFMGEETGVKLFSPIVSILLIISVYLITKKFTNDLYALISAVLISGVPLIVFYSIVTYVDIFTALIFLWFFYFLYKTLEKPTRKNIIITGIILGLAVLTKEVMMLIFASFLIYILLTLISKKFSTKELKIIVLISIIGLLVASPFFVRNYIKYNNPVFPLFPNVFGWDHIESKEGYYAIFEGQDVDIRSKEFLNILWEYLFYFIPIFIISIGYSFIKRGKLETIFISLAIGILTGWFFLLLAHEIRYLIPLIPITFVIFSIFLSKYITKNKIIKIASIIIILMLILLSLYNIYTISNLTKLAKTIPNLEKEYYEFIKNNVEEDAIIFDVLAATTAYHTNRMVSFPTQICGYDLWKFWDLSEEEAFNRFKRHGINYITFQVGYMSETETEVWGMIPAKAILVTRNFSFTELVFGNNMRGVYKINY